MSTEHKLHRVYHSPDRDCILQLLCGRDAISTAVMSRLLHYHCPTTLTTICDDMVECGLLQRERRNLGITVYTISTNAHHLVMNMSPMSIKPRVIDELITKEQQHHQDRLLLLDYLKCHPWQCLFELTQYLNSW